jgi:hypothetical protein
MAVPAVRFPLTSDLCSLLSPNGCSVPPDLRPLHSDLFPSDVAPLAQSEKPFLKQSVACPPSAGRGAEAFVWILPGSLAKITAGFFDDAALRPVRTGLVSVRDRPRSGSAEKTTVGFCAGKIQTKASLFPPPPPSPPRPASTHPPPTPARHRPSPIFTLARGRPFMLNCAVFVSRSNSGPTCSLALQWAFDREPGK